MSKYEMFIQQFDKLMVNAGNMLDHSNAKQERVFQELFELHKGLNFIKFDLMQSQLREKRIKALEENETYMTAELDYMRYLRSADFEMCCDYKSKIEEQREVITKLMLKIEMLELDNGQ